MVNSLLENKKRVKIIDSPKGSTHRKLNKFKRKKKKTPNKLKS